MKFSGSLGFRHLPCFPLVGTAFGARFARGDQNYSQQVFFENSLSPKNYFYSNGKASAPSTLLLVDGKLPVETTTFVSGPNALVLSWNSLEGGGWSAELHLYEWRNRTLDFPGADLWLWLYAKEDLPARSLPKLALRDKEGNFTWPLEMGAYAHDLKKGKWTRVRVPLAAFKTASVHPFQPHNLNALIFAQGAADAAAHALFIDDIRIEDGAPIHQAAPPAPQGVRAKGYERHIDISWNPFKIQLWHNMSSTVRKAAGRSCRSVFNGRA